MWLNVLSSETLMARRTKLTALAFRCASLDPTVPKAQHEDLAWMIRRHEESSSWLNRQMFHLINLLLSLPAFEYHLDDASLEPVRMNLVSSHPGDCPDG